MFKDRGTGNVVSGRGHDLIVTYVYEDNDSTSADVFEDDESRIADVFQDDDSPTPDAFEDVCECARVCVSPGRNSLKSDPRICNPHSSPLPQIPLWLGPGRRIPSLCSGSFYFRLLHRH